MLDWAIVAMKEDKAKARLTIGKTVLVGADKIVDER